MNHPNRPFTRDEHATTAFVDAQMRNLADVASEARRYIHQMPTATLRTVIAAIERGLAQ